MKKLLFIIIALLVIITASCNKTDKKTESAASKSDVAASDIAASDVSASAAKTEESAVSPETVETAESKWEIPANSPKFVKDAVKGAPKDAILGVGTARLASLNTSRTTATTRAHADIARQLSAVSSTKDGITETLSAAILSGVSVIDEDIDDDGGYWVVVMYKK